MDTEPLLSIGAFARAVGLAPSALRYYADAGLLTPAEVDVRTGYRYYTPDLERRALVIRRLREVGVSVETMRVVLDGTPDEAAAALRKVSDRAEDSARRTATAVADVLSAVTNTASTTEPVVVSLPGPELAVALRQVAHAASTDEGSPLAGVLVEVGGSELSIVATNRYWLARWSIELPQVRASQVRAVVPLDAVESLARWLVLQRTVSLCIAAEAARVSNGDDERSIPLLHDRFPAWRLVVEDRPEPIGRTVLPREQLLRALTGDAVALAVGEDRVTVRPDDGPEGVRVPATTTGSRIRLDFSVGLLAAVVRMMIGPEISIDYAASRRPVEVGSLSQPRLSALLMPA